MDWVWLDTVRTISGLGSCYLNSHSTFCCLLLTLELATKVRENFIIMEKVPSRAFSSWLKAPIATFTFKTLFSVL